MGATTEPWKPFASKQPVIRQRPGFDWDARTMMVPGVPEQVHGPCAACAGLLRGARFDRGPVVKLTRTPEMARGELLRFLAEMAGYPTALMPSQRVQWDAVDDISAGAALTDSQRAARLLFRLKTDSLMDTLRAQSRDHLIDSRTTSAPWQGRFRHYAGRTGMHGPLDGEDARVLPGGVKTCWRGTVQAPNPACVK